MIKNGEGTFKDAPFETFGDSLDKFELPDAQTDELKKTGQKKKASNVIKAGCGVFRLESLNDFEEMCTVSSRTWGITNALDAMIDVINALRVKGFKINVDDFGSGYSSLNQIANIPADIIKFDRVFASRSLKNNKGRQVIKSLIEMLKMVEYELVFEGVETKEELDTVVSYGCDVIQGFYFDRPLPANEFVDKYYTGSREITYGT